MLINTTGRRADRLERLLEISRHLGMSQELDTLLQSVVDASCELTESRSSSILLLEEETGMLKFVAGSQIEKEIIKRIRVPLENSIAGRVYTQCKPIVLHYARTDPHMFRDVEKALNSNVDSMIAVPMIFQGETIGVIEAVNKRDHGHYSDEDVTILETLASQAAVAILSTLMLEQMKEAYTELEESERKKSDFIAIASHELRTPLGLILGHATDLLETSVNEEQRSQLEVVVRSANRLKKIIDDFSSFDNLRGGDHRQFHKKIILNELVREVTASFQENARSRRITLMVDIPGEDIPILADRDKLCLALSNLIDNAITFTERGGHVLVFIEKLPGYARVSVIDDGIGIPAKDLPHIFERFYQVEGHLTRKHGGIGLGLSVAKAMVELHKGQIWVESVEGKGSNFSFLLPVRDEMKTAGEAPRPATRPFV